MPRKDKRPRPISEKTRQEDERLREELRNADLKKFDRAMDKLMKQPSGKPKDDAEDA
jgi:hypothetical protein